MSQNYNNIISGLNIPSQIPLDVKKYIKDEATLSSLGINNNLAYTYHDQLTVTCLQEKTTWIWREVEPGEENTGLLSTDFTYPTLPVIFDVNYSNKTFNFFKIEYALATDIKEILSPNGTIEVTETDTQIQLEVAENIANGSATQINAGTAITVTGTGTALDPYIINGKVYSAGTGISITGLGTTLSPYVISINNSNNQYGWITGDTKEVVCTREYINANFDLTGLGVNQRVGWAICNGLNGTPNDDGRVTIAFGTNNVDVGTTGGAVTHTLTAAQLPVIPPHTHNIRHANGALIGGYGLDGNNTDFSGGYYASEPSGGFGGGQAHNNMQPYIIRLRIMKL